jgi:hypothetical protein
MPLLRVASCHRSFHRKEAKNAKCAAEKPEGFFVTFAFFAPLR